MTRRPPWLVPAELSLVALTLATVAGFGRVLHGDWVGPLLAAALVGHLVPMLARRAGWGIPASAATTAVTGVLLLTWLTLRDTTTFLLPSTRTLDGAGEILRSSWETFREELAPVSAEPGLLLASGAGILFAAFLADWAAFRLWAPFEAVVPATTLFVFCSLLAGERSDAPSAALFAAGVIAFLLVHRVCRQASAAGWVTADVGRSGRSLLRVGTALGAVAVLVGATLGPQIPGAQDEPVVTWATPEERSGQRVTISPLVDIRSRLVNQSEVELFTVESDASAYWRLTSLDTFEDGIWKSSGNYQAATGALPSERVAVGPSEPAEQIVRVNALSALWLPAAFEPTHVESEDEVRFHPGSSTLIVGAETATSDGSEYLVRSEMPRHEPDALRAAPVAVPEDIAERYLALPEGLTPVAATTAAEVVGDATNHYDRARLLQDWFQAEFTYDLAVESGHDGDAIESFLDRRTGYCEQFAGTFAAMARTLGIPARVAVGFTPGEPDPANPSLHRVRGEHAHAWPEVWLGDHGWVAFEPTPGRGAPGAESHTGLPAAQEGEDPAPAEPDPTPTTTPEIAPAPPPPPPDSPSPPTPPEPVATADEPGGGPLSRTTLAVLGAVALLALYLGGVPAALALQRRRRRRHAVANRERVRVAWVESLEQLAAVGTRRDAPETSEEFAARAGRRLPSEAGNLALLASDADAATFAPDDVGEDVAARAEGASRQVQETVRGDLTRRQRVWRRLDPRLLLLGRRITPAP